VYSSLNTYTDGNDNVDDIDTFGETITDEYTDGYTDGYTDAYTNPEEDNGDVEETEVDETYSTTPTNEVE